MYQLGDLMFRKPSSPIHSSELNVKLQHAQSPQKIIGCVKLDPLNDLSEHFSSPPHRHVHIVVQLLPTHELSSLYFACLPEQCVTNPKYPGSHPHSPGSPEGSAK
jgi:hypothetical protein